MYDDQIKDKFVTQESDTNRYFTLANIISMLRIVLTVPAVWLFATNKWEWGLVILGVCVISDWLDGFVARITHEVSDFGKFIDPLADHPDGHQNGFPHLVPGYIGGSRCFDLYHEKGLL